MLFINMIRNVFVILFLLVIILTGCSPLIAPTTYQVPNLKEKGDAQLDAEGGLANFNAHLAYSPINNFALAVTENFYTSNAVDAHTGYHTAFGAGYYSVSDRLQWSIYSKFGYGSSTDRTNSNNAQVPSAIYFTEIKFVDYQLQPQINWVNGWAESYVGLRASLININSFSTTDPNRLSPGHTGTVEPFIGGRKGFDNLKFDLQAGIYAHGNSHISHSLINSSDAVVNINFGVAYMFNINKKHFGLND